LDVKTESSGDYVYQNGELRQTKKNFATRELKQNHNHDLKYLFKSMAQAASTNAGSLQDYYQGLLAKGIRQVALPHVGAQTRGDCFNGLEERSIRN
jgi:hypothetical protein